MKERRKISPTGYLVMAIAYGGIVLLHSWPSLGRILAIKQALNVELWPLPTKWIAVALAILIYALGVMLILRLNSRLPQSIKLVTFGSPPETTAVFFFLVVEWAQLCAAVYEVVF